MRLIFIYRQIEFVTARAIYICEIFFMEKAPFEVKLPGAFGATFEGVRAALPAAQTTVCCESALVCCGQTHQLAKEMGEAAELAAKQRDPGFLITVPQQRSSGPHDSRSHHGNRCRRH